MAKHQHQNQDTTRLLDWTKLDPDELHALGSLARTVGFEDTTRPHVLIDRDLSDPLMKAAAEWLLLHRRFPKEWEPFYALTCRALTWTDNETPEDDEKALMRIAVKRKAALPLVPPPVEG
jgi:hypothetical protein